MKLIKTVAVALLALALGFAATPAAHADGGTMTATPNPVAPGKSFTLSGTGCVKEIWQTPTVYVYAGKQFALGEPNTKGEWSVEITPTKDDGKSLAVSATCDQYGSSWSYKSVTVKVGTGVKALVGATPKISGTVQVGKKLTAKTGTWSPKPSFSYQWYRDGKKISKATKSTYTLTSSDKGTKITVKVTGKKSGYTSVTKTSKKTASVKAGTLSTKTPTISGTAKVGKKLTAKPGTWTSGTKFSYQWYRSGKKISKATKSTYTLSKSDKGKTITVKVKGTKSGYTSVTKTSKKTAKIKK
ncbi:hypothetical protein [Tessaracoccus caeni]|uniref:hypothetical protein n=1 Tax=Tessaracoccus caeni TaxID=3031239 RepID=UPI0023DCC37C|nr:hypothetical protein [Tessaracoccus caeni]MDF1489569.1 hypothetical protein [Tessaracoccus caeni]